MNNPKAIVATLFSALAGLFLSSMVLAQTNPLWTQEKVRNYLPHMSVPEVEDFLETSDLVIIPVGALEQHGTHLPIGTTNDSNSTCFLHIESQKNSTN